ncbi:MAG TPA: lytic transglycosylase, partial [Clostridiales bacterium]|nr:lytic transglycosylase [Clostridiales bacterium]
MYVSLICLVLILFTAIIMYLVVLYPIRYKTTIKKYSKIYNIDPEIVCSVINIESGFDKNALSKVGARGLMQIMPSTAEEIADKLNIKDFTLDMLYSPEINIRMGCYYL